MSTLRPCIYIYIGVVLIFLFVMEVLPISVALGTSHPVTSLHEQIEKFPILTDLVELRKKLSEDTNEHDDLRSKATIDYVGRLLVLRAIEGSKSSIWSTLLECCQFSWTMTTRTIDSPSLDNEITLTLSYLCSILGMQGERAAKALKVQVAQKAFTECAFAFDVLCAFLRRTNPSGVAEARLRAQVARIMAWQSQIGVLIRDKDSDRFAIALGLATAYWQVAQKERSTLASTYAHYWLMACAIETASTIDPASINLSELAQLEQFYALAVVEAKRVLEQGARFLHPPFSDFVRGLIRRAKEQQQSVRASRIKWKLVLAKNRDDNVEKMMTSWDSPEEGSVFSSETFELFPFKAASSPITTTSEASENDIWKQIITAGQIWLNLVGGPEQIMRLSGQGRSDDATSKKTATVVNVSSQLQKDIALSGLELTDRRDELLILLGRLSERLQWMQYDTHHHGMTVFLEEVEEVRKAIQEVGAAIKRPKV